MNRPLPLALLAAPMLALGACEIEEGEPGGLLGDPPGSVETLERDEPEPGDPTVQRDEAAQPRPEQAGQPDQLEQAEPEQGRQREELAQPEPEDETFRQ